MQILSQSTPTAKKKHRCNFCGLPINPGEKYDYQFNVNDGDACSWKSHPSCSALADKLDMYHRCDDKGVTEDDFYEIVCSKYCDITGRRPRDNNETWPETLEFVKEQVLTPKM
jgi:hypothetical protein